MKPRSYREAGVDIAREADTISSLVRQLRFRRAGVGAPLDLPDFFTAMVDFGEWALTLNTDSVGTKILVAQALGVWDTVGIDCVAMSVNDALCVGAEPLAMVDYLAVGRYDEEVAGQIGVGLNRGAERANVTLVGGEFATVPEIVEGYDLAGTCLGAVRKDAIVDGREVRPGQVLVGLPSSGPHANGYTLVRKLLRAAEVSLEEKVPGTGETWGEALLRPTEIYVREVLEVVAACPVAGMAHITGGGLRNLPRVRRDVGYEVSEPLPPQPVFRALQELGEIPEEEMHTTFNMGLGFVLILEEAAAEEALRILRQVRQAAIIGAVREGEGVRLPSKDLAL